MTRMMQAVVVEVGADPLIEAREKDAIPALKYGTGTGTGTGVVAPCITVRGSFVQALAFAADSKVKADIELQPLSAVNVVFDRLGHGQVASRVVLHFGSFV